MEESVTDQKTPRDFLCYELVATNSQLLDVFAKNNASRESRRPACGRRLLKSGETSTSARHRRRSGG